jgi:hypothetical protein
MGEWVGGGVYESRICAFGFVLKIGLDCIFGGRVYIVSSIAPGALGVGNLTNEKRRMGKKKRRLDVGGWGLDGIGCRLK